MKNGPGQNSRGRKRDEAPPYIPVTKILFKINLGTGIGEVVGTDPDRVSEEGVRDHDGGGWSLFTPKLGFGLALLLSL